MNERCLDGLVRLYVCARLCASVNQLGFDAILIGTPVRLVVVGIFAFSADEAPILGFTE